MDDEETRIKEEQAAKEFQEQLLKEEKPKIAMTTLRVGKNEAAWFSSLRKEYEASKGKKIDNAEFFKLVLKRVDKWWLQ